MNQFEIYQDQPNDGVSCEFSKQALKVFRNWSNLRDT